MLERPLLAALLGAATTFSAAVLFALPCAAQPADAVLGIWLTEPGDQGGRAHVEVSRDGQTFTGRIVWLEEPLFPSGPYQGQPKRDLENPDEALRERPMLGLTILSGMTHEGPGTWGGGTVYDPANGHTYSARMRLESADDDTLELRGYIGFSLFGRTSVWRRVR